MGEGGNSKPRTPAGNALPLVAIPTSAGAGAAANGRCLVWHPDDEVLVPLAEEGESLTVSLGYKVVPTDLSFLLRRRTMRENTGMSTLILF